MALIFSEYIPMIEILLRNFSLDGPPPSPYDFNFKTATVSTIAGPAVVITPFGASTLYQGEIYSFGGYNGGNVNTAYKYNYSTNTSTTLPVMPTPTHGASAVVYANKIYIFGGSRNDGTSNLIVFDPSTNTYTRENVTGIPAILYAKVAAYDKDVHIATPNGTANHYIVDLVTKTTTTINLAAYGIPAAFDRSVVRVGDWMYCIGGRSSRSVVDVKVCYKINCITKEVVKIADLPYAIVTGQQLYGAINEVYVVGNQNGSNSMGPTSLVYEINNDTWKEFTNPPNIRQHSSTAYVDKTFYLIGGWVSSSYRNDSIKYGT